MGLRSRAAMNLSRGVMGKFLVLDYWMTGLMDAWVSIQEVELKEKDTLKL
jgi:hypothetical protein